jgi:hypothetical protein
MPMWGQPPPAVRSSEARVGFAALQGELSFYDGGLVIAPCDADETSAAYFAKTPVG